MRRHAGPPPDAANHVEAIATSTSGTPAAPSSENTARVTDHEEAMLAMYGDMADAFDKQRDNCIALADSVEQIVQANQPALHAWIADRNQLSESARASADQRLEQAAGAELQRLRRSLRSGIIRCPNEQRLQRAIVTLAKAGRPQ